MFSFLKRAAPGCGAAPDSRISELSPERMSPEERMACWREMLYQSIRESLLRLQVISSMYKFRIGPSAAFSTPTKSRGIEGRLARFGASPAVPAP